MFQEDGQLNAVCLPTVCAAGSRESLCSRASASGAVVGQWDANEDADMEGSLPKDLRCDEHFPKGWQIT